MNHNRCSRFILYSLATVLTGATGVAIQGAWNPAEKADENFQQLVAGLGTGSVLDLSTSPGVFDVRLEYACILTDNPNSGYAAFSAGDRFRVFAIDQNRMDETPVPPPR